MAINMGPLGQMSNQPAPPSPTAQAQGMAQRAAEMEQPQENLQSLAMTTMDEVKAQREKLNSAVERMIAGLDRRKNLPFDPMLMKMSAAFLRPTKTGSFGESMGYAAEAAASEAEQEYARQQAEAKLELELQQKLLESKRQKAGMEVLAGLNPSAPGFGAATLMGGQPAAPGVPGGIPGVPGAAPGPAVNREVQETILGMRPVTLDFLSKYKDVVDPDTYKFLESAQKAQQGERELRQKEIQPAKYNMEHIGEVSVPPEVYRRYQDVLREVNSTGNLNLLAEFYAREGLGKRKFVPGTEGTPGKFVAEMPETPAEKEIELAGRKEFRTIGAKEAAARGTALIDRGAQAHNTRIVVQDAKAYADSNARAFDLLQKPTLVNQLTKAASDEGAQLGQFGSFTIPLRTIQQFKLDERDIEALQMYQARAAEITVQFRKTARAPGEGATTESEGRLYASLGLLPSDSSRVIKLKAEYLEKRADYDEEVARAYINFLKKPNTDYNDFLISDDFKDIKSRYEKDFKAMREANADLLRTAPKKATSAKSSKTLAEQLKEEREKRGE